MERGKSEYDLVRLIQIITKREIRYIDQDLTIIDTIQNSFGTAIVRNETVYGIISFLLQDLDYFNKSEEYFMISEIDFKKLQKVKLNM